MRNNQPKTRTLRFIAQSVTILGGLLALSACGGNPSGNHDGEGVGEGIGEEGETAANSDKDEDGRAISTDEFCENTCQRLNSCDRQFDRQTCEARCKNDNAASIPKLRGQILDDVGQCVDEADCATVLDSNVHAPCFSEAVASVAPTDMGTEFFEQFDDAAEQCGADLDRGGCLNLAKLFNDATLSDAILCLDKACSQIGDCVSATLVLPTETDGRPIQGSGVSQPPTVDTPETMAEAVDSPAVPSADAMPASNAPSPPSPSANPSSETATMMPSVPAGDAPELGAAGECSTCLVKHCTSEARQCAANEQCVALDACAVGCGADDEECISECGMEYPQGISDYLAFLECATSESAAQSCSTECAADGGEEGVMTPAVAGDTKPGSGAAGSMTPVPPEMPGAGGAGGAN